MNRSEREAGDRTAPEIHGQTNRKIEFGPPDFASRNENCTVPTMLDLRIFVSFSESEQFPVEGKQIFPFRNEQRVDRSNLCSISISI